MTEVTIKTFLTKARHTTLTTVAVKYLAFLGGEVFKVPPSIPSHPSKYYILWGISILFKALGANFGLVIMFILIQLQPFSDTSQNNIHT